MDEETPHIEVRAVQVDDAPALYELGYDLETDRIFTLRVQNHLANGNQATRENNNITAFTFELVETQVDPPLFKSFRAQPDALHHIDLLVRNAEGGFVVLVDGSVAGGIFLNEDARGVVHIQDLIVGRQYRRYNVGSLLLRCASDWGRSQKCWAIAFETQNTNYPAVQFYLHNGFEIWSVHRHFYPPGPDAHDVALFMGKRFSSPFEE